MNNENSQCNAALPARDMTKREVIAMHILAAYSNGLTSRDEEGYSFVDIAAEAVLQADALLVALHDDPEEADG